MSQYQRPIAIVGNWKMHKTNREAEKYVKELIPIIHTASSRAYLAVPFTALALVSDLCAGTNIVPGAQNMNEQAEGAFTGEICGKMLKDAGAEFVILGHSERRSLFHETNEIVNNKIKRALDYQLTPIVCIGETAQERDQGFTFKVLTSQLTHTLTGLEPAHISRLMLAYEPVWAIGTHLAAMPAAAEEAHHFCREFLMNAYGLQIAEKTHILYGGSVKPDNALPLLQQKNIDGFLVGTASLNAASFGKIINTKVDKV